MTHIDKRVGAVKTMYNTRDSRRMSGRLLLDHHHLVDRLSLHHISDDGGGSIHNIHCSVYHAREPPTLCELF